MTRTLSYIRLISLATSVLLVSIPAISLAAVAANGTTCDFVRSDGACMVSQNGIETNIGPAQSPTLTGGSSPDERQIDPSNPKINGCNANQTKIPNIGTFVATAPTYVPVYDDAVTINTGYLVFKSCVLDAIAAQDKIASTAKIAADTIKYIAQGDNGNPLFVRNIRLDSNMVTGRNTTEFYKSAQVNSDGSPVTQQAITASYQQYLSQTNGHSTLSSDTFGDAAEQQAFLQGNLSGGGGGEAMWKMALNPANSPGFKTMYLNMERDASNAQVAADRVQQLAWGNGYVAPETVEQVPTSDPNNPANIYMISTPGYVIAGVLGQAIGSGFDLQKNAQTIDQLVTGTYSGLQERVISDPNGVIGVSQPGSGGSGSSSSQSFLDQMFQSILSLIQNNTSGSGGSGGTTSTTASTSGLTKLIAALAIEQQYLTYDQQIETYLDTQTAKLGASQDACWVSLAGAVATIAGNTPYTVATSTTNAVAANTNLIIPVKAYVQQDIDHSTSTIAVLQGMIVGTASSTSPTTNQFILDQLAVLAANNTLHTAAQVAIAKQNVTDIQTNIGAKVDATIAIWKQGTGWCNVNSTTVVQSWLNAWKK
jgi:hypothetical protein